MRVAAPAGFSATSELTAAAAEAIADCVTDDELSLDQPPAPPPTSAVQAKG